MRDTGNLQLLSTSVDLKQLFWLHTNLSWPLSGLDVPMPVDSWSATFLCLTGYNPSHGMEISTYHLKFGWPRTLQSSFRALVLIFFLNHWLKVKKLGSLCQRDTTQIYAGYSILLTHNKHTKETCFIHFKNCYFLQSLLLTGKADSKIMQIYFLLNF